MDEESEVIKKKNSGCLIQLLILLLLIIVLFIGGKILYKRLNEKVVDKQSNDGTTIDKSNWKVEWKTDRVVVTIKGYDDSEEKIYTLFLVNN